MSTDPGAGWAVTRVANACVLLEVADALVLTDPWFTKSRAFTEHATLAVDELPELTAIIGCHPVRDHWEIGALDGYRHKDRTRVFVAQASMAEAAREAGFDDVEVLGWGQRRSLTDIVDLEVIEAHQRKTKTTNNYAIASPRARVFFGGETLRLEPVSRYAASHDPFDVALGPVNGVHLMGRQLTVTAAEMLEATRILGAPRLVAIHDSHKPIWPLLKIASSVRDLDEIDHRDVEVIELAPGARHEGAA